MRPRIRNNEIRFFINPKSTPDDIQAILDQIANMIYGLCSPGVAIKKKDGYQYGLGHQLSSETECFPNDWWADIGASGDAPNEIVVAYRYGNYHAGSEKLSKFRETIIWLLNLEKFNKEEPEDSETK